jgi:hypothetical protein
LRGTPKIFQVLNTFHRKYATLKNRKSSIFNIDSIHGKSSNPLMDSKNVTHVFTLFSLYFHRTPWFARPAKDRGVSRPSADDAKRLRASPLSWTTSALWKTFTELAIAQDDKY